MKIRVYLIMLFSIFMAISVSAQKSRCITDANNVNVISSKQLLDIEPNILESFETYSDFAIEFSPWILKDIDGTPTYGITDVSFPNSGAAMAYIVFNPNNTTPSLSGDAAMAANSGDKFAACFSSVPSSGPTNNDWLITPLMDLGSNSSLNFYGRSYTVEWGAEKLKVLVSTTGTDPSNFTEISQGTIELPAAWTNYNYDLSSYDGQDVYIAFQCISNDAFILMLDDILISTEEASGGSTLTGKVTDALNGEAIAGALVEVAGLSDVTDSEGNYSIANVPTGSLTSNFMASPTTGQAPLNVQFTDLSTSNTQLVVCSANGYITYNNNQVTIPDGSIVDLDISLSPTITGNEMRFVLNWGADPRDLDSHLRTPDIEGNEYHVFYNSQGSASSAPYATLDHDDTQSYGPETTTIYQFYNGEYHFYVHNYAGNGEIIESNAVVQIYNSSGILYTLQVPTSGTGKYWYVGTINGSNQSLNIINTIQETEPGTGKLNVVYPPKPKLSENAEAGITSWQWNFGDGQTSDLSNPSHIYQSGGVYSVTLAVSDGISQNTFTRQNYIYVEGSQGTSTLTGMVTNAVDGAPIEGALVEVVGLYDYTDSEGNYLIENVPTGTLTSNFLASPSQGQKPLNVEFTDLSTSNTQLVSCSADDFSTYNNNQVIIPEGSTVNLNISLSPNISGDGMRFVLNWGADPRDLDSHLLTPEIDGTNYHIFYGSQGEASGPPYATLDHDDTQSYGPETVTIYQFFNGVYHYYVHNFAGVGEITTSSAVVQIYDETGPLYTLQAPTVGEGDYWYVGTINGQTMSLNIINVIQESEPGTGKLNVVYPEKPRIYNHAIMGITSWSWNFGDGQTSSDQNPSHIYTADGLYTVSLTVGDGISTNQEVKLDYIKVGDSYSIDEMTEDIVKLYPNPAKDNVVFTSEKRITEFMLFDNGGKLLISEKTDRNDIRVDLQTMKPGIYMVKIIIEGKVISKKLIVR